MFLDVCGVAWGCSSRCYIRTASLTHWGRDKIATISQTTLSNAFSWMKMVEFRLKFHWSLFIRVQLTIFQHWFRWWLGADQATSHYLKQRWLDYRHIYASLGLNELKWYNRKYVFVPTYPQANNTHDDGFMAHTLEASSVYSPESQEWQYIMRVSMGTRADSPVLSSIALYTGTTL